MPSAALDLVVGRDDEIAALRGLVSGLVAGRGGVAWIEGEPGIGKSALVGAVVSWAREAGCRVCLAVGDELDQRLPLRALFDGLGADAEAEVGALTRGEDGGTGAAGAAGRSDPVSAAVEQVLALVDRWCARSPVVLAFDDLQWADEASLLVWRRLARSVGQIPLLLVGACRPVPAGPAVIRVRQAAAERGAVVVSVGPLGTAELTGLVARLAGARPGPRLQAAAGGAGGNPLYAQELVDALVREGRIRVEGGVAEVVGDSAGAPVSLGTAIAGRLGFLSPEAHTALRMAALLGHDFSAFDLATVTGHPASELLPALDEAIGAGVLAEADERLAFRHGLIQQAMVEATPASLRSALHRQVAEALDGAGLPVERVAAHLLVAPDAVDGWVVDWLAARALDLANRIPEVAVALLSVAADRCGPDDPRQEIVLEGRSVAMYLLNRLDEAEEVTGKALARATDPERIGGLARTLGAILIRATRYDEAVAVFDAALARSDLPPVWRARLLAARAIALTCVDRTAEAAVDARQALEEGQRLGDRNAIGYALHGLMAGADYEAGIGHADRALEVIGDDPALIDLRLLLLINLQHGLKVLGRADEAAAALGSALILAERVGTWRLPMLRVAAGVRHFERGEWDEAGAELDSVTESLAIPDRFTLLGVKGVIAAHRDDRAATAEILRAAADLPEPEGWLIKQAAAYLWMARAVEAEQRGGPEEAVAILAGSVVDDDELRRYLWLPDLVRLALAVADTDLARAAVAAAETDVQREPAPWLIWAARRARAVLDGDAATLLAVGEEYRAGGSPLDLGQACEEAAALLGRAGDVVGARAALTDGVRAYLELGAGWDVRRANARLRAFGVRRGPRSVRRRPSFGWESLTPMEVRIAGMVAEDMSNPDIAAALVLSRRTVQSHMSNIIAKLGTKSRVDIVLEARRHALAGD